MATASAHEMPVANRDMMRDFLAQSIGDQIHLVAMKPDDDPFPAGAWFGPNAERAADWASEQNALGKNVYWTVNRTRDGLNKKPKKTEIAAARFLHVDVDPPKDGSAWDRKAAQASLESFDPPPSFIIDSGGGFGGFWRLEYEAENWPAIELLNQSLEDEFGGDHCWNIDRLMRVPGSVNYPNAAKRARGRGVSFASVARADNGEAFDPEDMRCTLPAPKPRKERVRERVKLDGVQVATPAELGITTMNRLLLMIEKPRGQDRSKDVWGVACEMVRQGFSDAEIAGILLNDALAISAHILENTSPMRAVSRTISGARATVTADNDPSAQPGDTPAISATPFVWRDPRSIALRPWVYGRWLLRNTITAVVAPGGIGKSSLMASTILALATGRSLLGKTVWEGPKRVWYWNLEDDGEELSRQVHAAAIHHDVKPEECADRLFIDSGLDGATLCTAIEERDGFRILRPVIEALVAELLARKIDVLIVDPFVSSHAISENDNGAIDAVAKEWARVAKRAGCSIVLVHHTRKLAGQKVTAEASRGAIALIAAARSTLVLNRMDTDEAKHFGIGEDDERRRLFNVQDDKANRAPAEKAEWYRLASVDLGNGGMDGVIPGDNIGVVTCWTPPDPLADVPVDALYRVQCEVSRRTDAERYRADVQSPAWVGIVVADVMELSAAAKDKADRARINQLLRIWIDNGALVKVDGKDAKANPRTFVEVGHWVDAVSSPSRSEVRKGGDRWGNDLPHPTSPIKRRGGEDGEDQGVGEVGKPAFVNGNPALGIERSSRVVFPEADGAALARQMLTPLPDDLRDPFDPSDEDE